MGESRLESRVSILLCVYNGEKFLDATIESALAQTYADFELIVVDDGSTDGSPAVLAGFGDPRIRIIRQENGGPAAALATGLTIARGAYVAFLDQDDLWQESYLAAHVDLLERRPWIDLSFSWFRVIDETGQDIGLKSARYHGTIDFQSLLVDFVIAGTSNIVARRTAIERAGGFDAAFRCLYDLDLCLRIALPAPRGIEAIPRDLMRYRRHPKQITRNIEALREEWMHILHKMRHLAPSQVTDLEHRARSNMSRYFARLAYEANDYGTGLRFIAEGFSSAPAIFIGDRRNWLTVAACLAGLLLPQRLCRLLEPIAGLRRRPVRFTDHQREITEA